MVSVTPCSSSLSPFSSTGSFVASAIKVKALEVSKIEKAEPQDGNNLDPGVISQRADAWKDHPTPPGFCVNRKWIFWCIKPLSCWALPKTITWPMQLRELKCPQGLDQLKWMKRWRAKRGTGVGRRLRWVGDACSITGEELLFRSGSFSYGIIWGQHCQILTGFFFFPRKTGNLDVDVKSSNFLNVGSSYRLENQKTFLLFPKHHRYVSASKFLHFFLECSSSRHL